MSLSEENARLMAEVEALKQSGGVNGSSMTNGGDDKDTHQLQATVAELSSHVRLL